ncbi:MAG: DUF1566 domain-containing protein [Saccharospirillum sp.]|nr:DUF1566 domain-containing protein [Saccharospirillum sp.]
MNKILITTALCGTALLLGACDGGSGSGSNTTGDNGNTGGNNTGTDVAVDTSNLAVRTQPVRGGVVVDFETISGADTYLVYTNSADISSASPSAGGSAVFTCQASPCLVSGLENGRLLNLRLEAASGSSQVEISSQLAVVAGAINDSGDQTCIYINSGGTGFPDGAAVCGDLPATTEIYPRMLSIAVGPEPITIPDGKTVGYDGLRGRDSQSDLIKLGSGEAGFDFTKLDSSGNSVASNSTSHDCVRDNVTGLVWSNDIAYATFPVDHDMLESQANSFGRCGLSSGWRLPTKAEAREIVNYDSAAAGERIDEGFFTALVAATETNQWYWTGSNAPKQLGDGIYVNPSQTPNAGTFYPWVINYRTGEFSVLDASCHNSGTTCPTAYIMFVNDSAAQ